MKEYFIFHPPHLSDFLSTDIMNASFSIQFQIMHYFVRIRHYIQRKRTDFCASDI